jgi:hypothetical protein
MNKIKNFKEWISLNEAIVMPPEIYGVEPPDRYGETIGIKDKEAKDYKLKDLNLPSDKPIGDITKSAWANLNVPTRGIAGSDQGNMGCAAAVSIIFYRATGLPIIKGREKNPIELGTAALWTYFTGKDKDRWEIIKDWKTQSKPGDIILTSRGRLAGHVGIVVENNKIISNSSSGFAGDKKGQIELNYTMETWARDTAIKNPLQTASFRYKGEYLDGWGGKPILTPMGSNDDEAKRKKENLSPVIIKDDVIIYMKELPPSLIPSILMPDNPDDIDKLLIRYIPDNNPEKKKILGLFKRKK